jgi:hypothetical protein
MVKLFIVQGDTAILQISLTNVDCTPIDLTNYQITFTIKRSHFDTDGDALFQGTLANTDITIIGPNTNGVIQVVIPHSNTVLMRQGKPYYWDVQLEDASSKIFTPNFGLIYAVMEVTQGA